MLGTEFLGLVYHRILAKFGLLDHWILVNYGYKTFGI